MKIYMVSLFHRATIKNLPCGHHRTTLSGCIFVTKAHIDSRKKLVKQQYLLSPPHILTIWRMFGTPQQISTGFASWLRYCSNVTHWRPTKLCMMFDHLLHYNIYTWNFARCIQVLCSSILAALLHGTRAVGISQTLRC